MSPAFFLTLNKPGLKFKCMSVDRKPRSRKVFSGGISEAKLTSNSFNSLPVLSEFA